MPIIGLSLDPLTAAATLLATSLQTGKTCSFRSETIGRRVESTSGRVWVAGDHARVELDTPVYRACAAALAAELGAEAG